MNSPILKDLREKNCLKCIHSIAKFVRLLIEASKHCWFLFLTRVWCVVFWSWRTRVKRKAQTNSCSQIFCKEFHLVYNQKNLACCVSVCESASSTWKVREVWLRGGLARTVLCELWFIKLLFIIRNDKMIDFSQPFDLWIW